MPYSLRLFMNACRLPFLSKLPTTPLIEPNSGFRKVFCTSSWQSLKGLGVGTSPTQPSHTHLNSCSLNYGVKSHGHRQGRFFICAAIYCHVARPWPLQIIHRNARSKRETGSSVDSVGCVRLPNLDWLQFFPRLPPSRILPRISY